LDPEVYEVPWLAAYLNEFALFSGVGDLHDDQVDATTQLLNYVRGLGSFNVMEFYRRKALDAAAHNKFCIRCQQAIVDNEQYIREGDREWHATCPLPPTPKMA
jgi:hypothetical protein